MKHPSLSIHPFIRSQVVEESPHKKKTTSRQRTFSFRSAAPSAYQRPRRIGHTPNELRKKTHQVWDEWTDK